MTLFTITGRKNVGKTTLVERLVVEFVRRGYRVATIKHTHHTFGMDREGTDSWRHRAAGAERAVIVSGSRLGLVRTQPGEQPLDALCAEFGTGCDLVLAEGFKEAPVPRIEVLRRGFHEELLPGLSEPVAVVADFPLPAPCPLFSPEETPRLADFLEAEVIRDPPSAVAHARVGDQWIAPDPAEARALQAAVRQCLAARGADTSGLPIALFLPQTPGEAT